jgi:hypothetical protein
VLAARDRGLVREQRVGPALRVAGWVIAAVVAAVSVVYLAQQLIGR